MSKKTEDSQRFSKMIGANLKFLRLNRDRFMPQKVPAGFIGITYQQLEKYENGKNMPCAYRIMQLADFYKVTPNDIYNPSYIHEQTRSNETLDKAPTQEIKMEAANGNI